MLAWSSSEKPEIELAIGAVTDASHGNESEYLDDQGKVEPFRSQGAKLLVLSYQRICSWIDTTVMPADSLTKLMTEKYFVKVLDATGGTKTSHSPRRRRT